MRDFTHIDMYLNKLIGDVYNQPEDTGHSALAKKVIDHWLSRLTGCKNVLDVGCGTGFAEDFFKSWNVEYEGVCLGEDYLAAEQKGRNVYKMDYSFLEYSDEKFDLVFSRHSLEHSPFPLLTLMEWRRVSKQWLGLVVPSPEWYAVKGSPNHYYVLYSDQWVNLLENAGWNVIWNEADELPPDPKRPDILKQHEIWLFCEKKR